jgi:serine protease Do
MQYRKRSKRWIHSVLGLLFLLCALGHERGFCGSVANEEQVIAAVKKIKPCVVNIATMGGDGGKEGGGSGVIISRDGYILTNTHVIQGAKTITVSLSNGKKFSAFIVRAASDRDLAVIKINCGSLPVPTFGDSSSLQLGQTAIAIGNPLKFSWSVTLGCISALNRDVKAKGILYRDLIQTDAAINPGSSGGALVNSKGEVIGINTLVYTGTPQYTHAIGLSFAIPSNVAMSTAKFLMKGEVQATPKPWIGISGVSLTKDTAEVYDLPIKSGILVDNVVAYGPAAKAGILAGDVITEVNNQKVISVEDFKALLNGYAPGQVMELTVWHQARKKKVQVTVEHLSQ